MGTVSVAADHHTAQSSTGASTTPLFKGLGTWTHKVTTSSLIPGNTSTKDCGLFTVLITTKRRSFKEAARLDPNCAMAYWGIAFTLGPNYNLPTDLNVPKPRTKPLAGTFARLRSAKRSGLR